MKRFNQLLRPLSVALLICGSVATVAETTLSIPSASKGKQCVDDTDKMRRQHMDLLKHHRNEALREGIRTKQYSLVECIECHVPADYQMQAATNNTDHFCVNCHQYAAVKIDCFECHAATPDSEKSAMRLPSSDTLPLSLLTKTFDGVH